MGTAETGTAETHTAQGRGQRAQRHSLRTSNARQLAVEKEVKECHAKPENARVAVRTQWHTLGALPVEPEDRAEGLRPGLPTSQALYLLRGLWTGPRAKRGSWARKLCAVNP